jgi:hypothetical protein
MSEWAKRWTRRATVTFSAGIGGLPSRLPALGPRQPGTDSFLNCFRDQLDQAISTAVIHSDFDRLSRDVWRAWSSGALTDAQAQCI